jgi:DNA-binding GntR family transcriptional regulator
MGELGVAATTARRAMRLLAEEGLIVTTPGRGSHVVEH